jgi:hypothetical protein
MTNPIDQICRNSESLGAAAIDSALTMVLAILLIVTPCEANAESTGSNSPSLDGHFALGGGMTYQYDGSKGTTVGVATWSADNDHYELAAFRFLSAQTRFDRALAEPNWVFEASRRWQLHWSLIDRSGVELFVGGGAAYVNKTDDLNGSNWNFAEQLGWRFPKQANGHRLEFAIRHVSNAGIKKPNRGEDFLTLAYVF